jgi:hypothetical protein
MTEEKDVLDTAKKRPQLFIGSMTFRWIFVRRALVVTAAALLISVAALVVSRQLPISAMHKQDATLSSFLAPRWLQLLKPIGTQRSDCQIKPNSYRCYQPLSLPEY